MKRTRVMIVDDSATIRAMLEHVISADAGCQVVGVAADADSALTLMTKTWPDVMTLDLNMPGTDGLEFLQNLHGVRHPPIVVVSSISKSDARETAQALDAGAVACFDKANLLADVPRLLRKLKAAAVAKNVRTSSNIRRGLTLNQNATVSA